jgi:hypothetical protein
MARSKRLGYLILIALAGAFFVFQKSTPAPGAFSLDQISSSLQPNAAWDIPAPSSEDQRALQNIFSSRFKFLGEGAQAYAFESEDGRYVLKFFKMRRFTSSWQDYLCPLVAKRRLKNLRWAFNGYKTAYDEMRQATGLVFIHLAKTDHLKQNVHVLDAQGKEYDIDLDKTEFVLQEKAELLFARLDRLYRQGDRKGGEKAISAVLDLVRRRIEKGYVDRDKAVSNNFGFVGDRAIQLDIGRLYKGTKEGQLEHVQRRIQQWQEENSVKPSE